MCEGYMEGNKCQNELLALNVGNKTSISNFINDLMM